jgi:4,5-dihydroxyphthalate decarboxylase
VASKLKLSLACWDYDRTRPLIEGRIAPEGLDLRVETLRPRQMFPRMLERQEFDCSELSLASIATLIGRGDCPFVALPIPISKFFRHSCIYVRAGADIARPQDLVGKRVGTTQYGSTAAVFMRGFLQDDYGFGARDLRWFMGGLQTPTEAPLVPLDLPSDISLDYLKPGQTLEAMFEAGELDALMSIYLPDLFLRKSPQIVRLFANYRQAEEDWWRRTGVFPIMHVIAMRRDVHEAHPWIAASLYEAFRRARDMAIHDLYDTDALRVTLPWLIHHVEETRAVFGDDYWAYGFSAVRTVAAAIGRYVFEQGLSPRPVAAEEIFLPLE